MNFQETPSNGSKDTADKVFHFPNKLPLVTDLSQLFSHCSECLESMRYEILGESYQWKPRYTWQNFNFSKYSALNY